MRSHMLDGGAYCRTAFALANTTATAGGAGDNTQVNTAWIDRVAMAPRVRIDSAKLVIPYTTTLAITRTLSFAVQIQDANDTAGAGAAAYEAAVGPTVVRTAVAAGTFTGTVEVDINLVGANKCFRAQITPDLSAAGVDTLAFSAMFILFCRYEDPAGQAIAKIGYPLTV